MSMYFMRGSLTRNQHVSQNLEDSNWIANSGNSILEQPQYQVLHSNTTKLPVHMNCTIHSRSWQFLQKLLDTPLETWLPGIRPPSGINNLLSDDTLITGLRENIGIGSTYGTTVWQ